MADDGKRFLARSPDVSEDPRPLVLLGEVAAPAPATGSYRQTRPSLAIHGELLRVRQLDVQPKAATQERPSLAAESGRKALAATTLAALAWTPVV
jgi:hypothetical protein